MTFIEFARAHGLIVRDLVIGRWTAVPTEDHPHKRNGRYKWLGDVGWAQNWATMTSPAMWKGEAVMSPTMRKIIANQSNRREEEAVQAAKKAAWILHQCQMQTHPYLAKKGFEEELGNVWDNSGQKLLVIPMRKDGKLVGVQLIDEVGNKRFLKGQVTKGATFTIDARGLPIFVEGYATGLSVRAAMRAAKIRYTIYCCFSATNLTHVALQVGRGMVVADNDLHKVGEAAAQKAGMPYWMSELVGEDFNDYSCRSGVFSAMMSLRAVVNKALHLNT